MRSQQLTTWIVMVMGIVVGAICDQVWPDPAVGKAITGSFRSRSIFWLRLVKMIIAPLVFSTLVVGIAHLGDSSAIGRIGLKAMLWFIAASLVSLAVGLLLAHAPVESDVVGGVDLLVVRVSCRPQFRRLAQAP